MSVRRETATDGPGLLARARAGDAVAFAELFPAPTLRQAHRLAAAVLGDADEAEDAVQDALVRAWRHRGKLHDTAGLDKWLFVIVKREAIRRLGSPWRRWVILTGQNLIGASKPRAVAGGELWDAVEAAVSGLSVNHRSVVILHAYWDMDFEDIATVLRIPVGTAKSRFARGAVRLRALMAAYEGEQ